MAVDRAAVLKAQVIDIRERLIFKRSAEIIMRLGVIPSLRRLFLLKDLAFGIYPQ